ncbi:MAG TPA: hypothetical protein PLW14_04610 [Chlorobiota bacterium]|nr:hypothetical protein [Chlorobiota bacterium]
MNSQQLNSVGPNGTTIPSAFPPQGDSSHLSFATRVAIGIDVFVGQIDLIAVR